MLFSRWPLWVFLIPLGLLAWLLWLLLPMMMPFAVAATLAYIVKPLAHKLERRKIPRALVAFLLVVLVCLLAILGALLLVPMWVKQVQALWARLPILVAWLQHDFLPWLEFRLGVELALSLDPIHVSEFLTSNVDTLKQAISGGLPILTSRGLALLLYLANLILIPVLFFYFLCEREILASRTLALIPPRWEALFLKVVARVDRVLGEFLHGQLLVMLIMAGVYSVGWWLVGLQSGLAIGVMTGLLVFIPYIGAIMGIGLALLAAILQGEGWSLIAAVGGVYVFGQLLESYLITPYLVGERIGLSPLEVIFALMAFGQLFGFIGVMVALPLAAILRVLVLEMFVHYKSSRFYSAREFLE